MILRPPISTRTATLCPYTTLFRSVDLGDDAIFGHGGATPMSSCQPAISVRWFPSFSPRSTARRRHRGPTPFAPPMPSSYEHSSVLQSLIRFSFSFFFFFFFFFFSLLFYSFFFFFFFFFSFFSF